MSEKNKAVVRRQYEEIWGEGNLDAVDEVYAPDFVGHNLPAGFPSDTGGLKQAVALYRAAFTDMRMAVEDMIVDGDKVVTRWTAKGAHNGELMGIPPTGKQTTVTGIDIFRLVGGKIVESWGQFDQVGMLQQIGAIPS